MNDDSMQPVELGPRVAERVRAFEVAYDGGCGHEADQWCGVGSLRSWCIDCLRASGPLAPWARPDGPCDVCVRSMSSTPTTWAVGTAVGVIAVARMCGECAATEVLALGEPGEGDDRMTGFDSRDRGALARDIMGARPRSC